MISAEELRQMSRDYGRQCVNISNEVAVTVAAEEDRHFRAGKARALSYLANGYSKAAIVERAEDIGGMFRTKLSRPEGHQIFLRAIAAAVAEWDNRAG